MTRPGSSPGPTITAARASDTASVSHYRVWLKLDSWKQKVGWLQPRIGSDIALFKGLAKAVLEASAEDRAFLAIAAQLAEGIDWAADPWRALTDALKQTTGRKGRALFLPLRRALTGRDHGPDMAALLPLIGRERAVARLTPA